MLRARLFIPLLALFFLSLSACAPKGYVMPEYATQSFVGKTLVIAPLNRPPIIDNPSDVADDIGAGVVEDVFMDHFKANFPDSLLAVSAFGSVVMSEYAEETDFEDQALDLEKGAQMGIALPPTGTTVAFDGGTPDVILFLEDLRAERTDGSAPTSMGGAGKTPTLVHAAEYAYWDNRAGRVISYGKIVDDTSFFLSMKESTWKSALGGLARGTVRGGPLAN